MCRSSCPPFPIRGLRRAPAAAAQFARMVRLLRRGTNAATAPAPRRHGVAAAGAGRRPRRGVPGRATTRYAARALRQGADFGGDVSGWDAYKASGRTGTATKTHWRTPQGVRIDGWRPAWCDSCRSSYALYETGEERARSGRLPRPAAQAAQRVARQSGRPPLLSGAVRSRLRRRVSGHGPVAAARSSFTSARTRRRLPHGAGMRCAWHRESSPVVGDPKQSIYRFRRG